MKKDKRFIPTGDYCYFVKKRVSKEELKSAETEGYKKEDFWYEYMSCSCPYWEEMDYGMVVCHYCDCASLLPWDYIGGEGTSKERAIKHYGSKEAFELANNGGLLYDQLKSCGENPKLDEEFGMHHISEEEWLEIIKLFEKEKRQIT